MRLLIKALFILICCSLPMLLKGQDPPKPGYEKINAHKGCNYFGEEKETEYYAYYPSNEAVSIMEEILAQSGASKSRFQLRSSNVNNAVALEEEGIRYILYSQEFLRKIEKDAQSKWAVYGILAHEMGHHINAHDFNNKDPEARKQMELEADESAGRILYALCANEEQALAAINAIRARDVPANYPSVSARREKISNAWFDRKEELQKQGKEPCTDRSPLDFGSKYNKWNRAKNVEAIIKEDQMIISYEAEPRKGRVKCEAYIVTSKTSGLTPSSVEWKSNRTQYGDFKEVIWHFGKDGYTREQVRKPKELGIVVFEKRPQSMALKQYAISGGSLLVGGLVIGVGLKRRTDALDLHDIYEQNRDPGADVYSDKSRQTTYDDANQKYRDFQTFRNIGIPIIAGGLTYLTFKLLEGHKSKIGQLYIGEYGAGVKRNF